MALLSGRRAPSAGASAVQASLPCSELALLQPVNVVAELEGRPQLQTHVLHHRVTSQQEQGLAIDLLEGGGGCHQRPGWSVHPGSHQRPSGEVPATWSPVNLL